MSTSQSHSRLASRLSRRTFLQQSGRVTAGVGLAAIVPKLNAADSKPAKFQISLAERSLNKAIFGKKLDHLDFPKAARQDYGIEGIELVNQFFMSKAKDQAYLRDFKNRAQSEGVKILLIMCDSEGQLGDPNEQAR